MLKFLLLLTVLCPNLAWSVEGDVSTPYGLYRYAMSYGEQVLSGDKGHCVQSLAETVNGQPECQSAYLGYLNLTMQYMIDKATQLAGRDWEYHVNKPEQADFLRDYYQERYTSFEALCRQPLPDGDPQEIYDIEMQCLIENYQDLLLGLADWLHLFHGSTQSQ